MARLLLLFLASRATAFEPPWLEARVHPVVAHMPRSAETSIEAVARYVAARVIDPIERVKALHDWVADRIAYDVDALAKPYIPPTDAWAIWVFSERKGVCSGYADLLQELGRAIGIDIDVVIAEQHAWNAVSFAGRRYEIDATWDAGEIVDGRFVKRYSTKYLFVTGHGDHPDEKSWAAARRAGPALVPTAPAESPVPLVDPDPIGRWVATHLVEPRLDWDEIGL